MPARYEYVNGNIKYKHEYAYTTSENLPTTPLKTIEYHYEDSTWSDVLTKITETNYSSTNSSSSTYSLNGVNNNNSSSINTLAQSLLGDDYREVDLTANALINVGAIHESPESNISTYSVNSNSTTLYEFQSDEIGNITNVSGVEINWNGRRLESISAGGTDLISYKYNIDGQRISKTYDGVTTEYFYNGNILAGQKKGNDTIIFMYDNNGDVFGFEYNGTPYYYVKNAQNDVFLILDQNGQPVVLYFYDAWGNITTCLDGSDVGLASINPITYRSYYMDVELGFFMYYLNSRYYMADWGRFVSADSYVQTGQGMLDKNMFAYCGNNPVNMVDDTGCDPIPIWAKNIVYGTATEADYIMALSVDPSAWAGSAGNIVRRAISIAEEQYNQQEQVLKVKQKPNMTQKRKDKRHGSENRQPTGQRERNVAHPNGEEHSRVAKGNGIRKVVATGVLVGATVAIAIVVADDVTGVGVINDTMLVPTTAIWWDAASMVFA